TISRLDSPARTSPVNAWSDTLRYQAHDSGTERVASSYSVGTFTHYLPPVLIGAPLAAPLPDAPGWPRLAEVLRTGVAQAVDPPPGYLEHLRALAEDNAAAVLASMAPCVGALVDLGGGHGLLAERW